MSIIRNKAVIGLVCILAGLGIVFLAMPAMANEEVKTRTVYMADTAIREGTILEPSLMKETVVPESLVPEHPIGDEHIGQIASTAISAGDFLTADKFAAAHLPSDTYSPATDHGKMVMSISVRNLSTTAAARIEAGDVVSVISLPQKTSSQSAPQNELPGFNTGAPSVEGPDEQEQPVEGPDMDEENSNIADDPVDMSRARILPLLRHVEVAAVVADRGVNASVKSELDEDEQNLTPVTVSFYVTEQQALLLAELEHTGSAHIAFVARGEQAEEFIDDKVLHITRTEADT